MAASSASSAASSAPATGPASAANAGYSLPAAIALAEAAQGAPPPAQPDIYQAYKQQGAMGDLFAPAYIAGYKPSQDAVAAWNAAHSMSRADVDATAMPGAWQPPQARQPNFGGPGVPLPSNQIYGDSMVDPAALRAQAQGTPYDPTARRAAIAQQVAKNQAAQASFNDQLQAYAQAHLQRYGYLPTMVNGSYPGLTAAQNGVTWGQTQPVPFGS
jgi:hypothetical protein